MKNILVIAVFMCLSVMTMAQSKEQSLVNDSTELVKRKQTLELKKAAFEKELQKVQDDKSYMQYGVAPDKMELLQIANDSTRLELKSKILEVDIELKEVNRVIAGENLLQNAALQQVLSKPPKKK